MLTRKLLKTSLCIAVLGWGAARLYGEVMLVPNGPADCADGACVPRRTTNGYFPTKWRRWPVEPPARPELGVRPGIPAPPVELPAPTDEIRLPSGSMIGPGPGPDQGPPPPADTAPQNGPAAPPAGRAVPEAEPRPDLPPALRNAIPPPTFDNQGSRVPSDHGSPRRIPTLASRARNRTAAVVEAIGADGQWKRAAEGVPAPDSRVPDILPPDKVRNAEPLRKPSDDPAPHTPLRTATDEGAARAPFSRDAFAYSNQRADWIEQYSHARHDHGWTAPDAPDAADEQPADAPADQSLNKSTAKEFAPPHHAAPASTPLGARLSALRQSTSESDDSAGWSAQESEEGGLERQAPDPSQSPTSQSSLRMSPAGLNTPASLGMRDATANVRRASAVADLTISAPSSAAMLAVRTVGADDWNGSTPAGNPLRGGSRIKRVVFETAEPNESESTPSAPSDETSTLELTVPANPLR